MSKDLENLSTKGLTAALPQLECFPTQFKNFTITISVPEYTSVCPKTGLPDFGTITIAYIPNKLCVELKSFKYYIHAYRNIGISYENVVNRILKDLVKSTSPKWMSVQGNFTPRGGISSIIEASFGKKNL